MLTQRENELLTQTGPGTPCGDLMRRYWQPTALSEELPTGGAPLPVRILGEDLVLFRDDQDRPGLLGLHCSHRGADLSYGRVEDGGLRCLYHGWLYDIKGRCLEQPGEPAGSDFCGKIYHRAHPCQEKGGVIFSYMGPGEPPLLPNYEFLGVPEDQRVVTKFIQDCNYLQGNEGNIDPVHNALLHHPEVNQSHNYRGFHGGRGPIPGVQVLECEPTDFGVALCYTSPNDAETKNIRTFNFVMPNLTVFPGQFRGHDGFSCNWHVPIDDTHHWKYTFIFRRSGPIDGPTMLSRLGSIGAGYRLIQNKDNRYMQDRSLLATASYSGIPSVAAQDTWATEGEGTIQDRTQEHLGYSDKIIVIARRMMLKAIQDVQHGDDPPHVIRHPDQNRFSHMVVRGDQVPVSTDWKEFRKDIASRGQTTAATG